MLMTEGFAVVTDDGIDIRTVSETPRAARINWLVLNGCTIYEGTPYECIEDAWRMTNKSGAYACSVKVTEQGRVN